MIRSLNPLFFLLIFSVTVEAKTPSVVPTESLSQLSLAPMIKGVLPAVVNLSIQGEIPMLPPGTETPTPPASLNPSLRSPSRKFEGKGSGVVIDAKKGHILTNAHLIKNSTKVIISLSDGRKFSSQVIGSDPATDIALLEISANNLTQLPLGNSDKLQVGDFVAAIGNPFGLNRLLGSTQTVTFGIVSALNRSEIRPDGYDDFIQTDAAINLGNSGGALVNLKGELVGITTAMLVPPGGAPGNIGISFAVPINMALDIADQLLKYGSIKRGFLGTIVQSLTPELAAAFKLPAHAKGALVTQITPGSPAEQAGLMPGDLITKINKKQISDSTEIRNTVALQRIGEKITLNYVRNGKELVSEATITDASAYESKISSENPYLYSAILQDLTEKSPVHGMLKGIQIQGISEMSPMGQAGLMPGDILTEADRQPIENIAQLTQLIERKKSEDPDLLLRIVRGPSSFYAVVKKIT